MTMPAADPQSQSVPPAPFSINVNPLAAPTPPTPPAPTGQQFMTREEVEALMNNVRTEEKNKLYPHIEEQQQQIAALTHFKEAAEAEKAAAEQAAAEAERLRQEADMTALQRLEQYQSDQDRRFKELEAERDRDRVLLQREREFAQVNEYRIRRLAEESENIAPQLVDFVQGFTQEEIESSVQLARQKSQEILEEFQARQQQSQPGYRPPVIPVSGTPMVDPNDLTGASQQVELTNADIAAMTPAEYAAYRPQILQAMSQHVREGGLYR